MELFCASSNPCAKQLVLGLCLQISGHFGSRSLGMTSSHVTIAKVQLPHWYIKSVVVVVVGVLSVLG